jgi:hypothetical protein
VRCLQAWQWQSFWLACQLDLSCCWSWSPRMVTCWLALPQRHKISRWLLSIAALLIMSISMR